MPDLIEYLDQAKAKTGSDYRTAPIIGVSRAQISNVRNGAGLSDDAALLLAELIGEEPWKVIATANIHRTKSPQMKARWERYARGAALAVVLVFSGLNGLAVPAPARAAMQATFYPLCAVEECSLDRGGTSGPGSPSW